MTATSPTDLAGGDREPIHAPGGIQPRGVLLVLSEPDHAAVQASENVGALLGPAVADVLGRPLDAVVGPDTAAALRAEFDRVPTKTRPVALGLVHLANGRPFFAVAHRTDGGIVLEFESAAPGERGVSDIHAAIDEFARKAEAAQTVADLSRLIREEMRAVTGSTACSCTGSTRGRTAPSSARPAVANSRRYSTTASRRRTSPPKPATSTA